MDCCRTSSSELILDKFIMDGRAYVELPVSWNTNFGPRTQSLPTISLRRIVTTQEALIDELAAFGEQRKVVRQSWTATWNYQSSPVSRCMRDHLIQLYTLQRHFWLQFDDEMSHDPGLLICADSGYRNYFTPTYPVVPLGYSSVNPLGTHEGNLMITGEYPQDLEFNVDHETGRVHFNKPLGAHNQVYLHYTWKARVRIANIAIKPVDIAQTYYEASVTFEQVISRLDIDPWFVTSNMCTTSCASLMSEYVFNTPANSLPTVLPSETSVISVPSVSSEVSVPSIPQISQPTDINTFGSDTTHYTIPATVGPPPTISPTGTKSEISGISFPITG